MTLYLVTHGCYSSYGVVAVYDDRGMAEAYIGHPHPKDGTCGERNCECDIEEYELNPHADAIRANLKLHRVVMDRHGNVELHESHFGGEPTTGDLTEWNAWQAPKRHRFQVYVRATSDEQAIKAANEGINILDGGAGRRALYPGQAGVASFGLVLLLAGLALVCVAPLLIMDVPELLADGLVSDRRVVLASETIDVGFLKRVLILNATEYKQAFGLLPVVAHHGVVIVRLNERTLAGLSGRHDGDCCLSPEKSQTGDKYRWWSVPVQDLLVWRMFWPIIPDKNANFRVINKSWSGARISQSNDTSDWSYLKTLEYLPAASEFLQLKRLKADPCAFNGFRGGELSFVGLSLQPTKNNQGDGEPHNRIGLQLIESLAKFVLFVWSINYGATGGYVRKAIALLGLLIVLSGVTWL